MFRIWFPHTVVEGETGEDWAAAPSEGVQVIYEGFGRDDHGRQLGAVHNRADHYWLHEGRIGKGASSPERGVSVPYDGPEGAVVKTGLWIDNYEEVYADFRAWLAAHNAKED